MLETVFDRVSLARLNLYLNQCQLSRRRIYVLWHFPIDIPSSICAGDLLSHGSYIGLIWADLPCDSYFRVVPTGSHISDYF